MQRIYAFIIIIFTTVSSSSESSHSIPVELSSPWAICSAGLLNRSHSSKASNRLKLKVDKTEVRWTATRRSRDKLPVNHCLWSGVYVCVLSHKCLQCCEAAWNHDGIRSNAGEPRYNHQCQMLLSFASAPSSSTLTGWYIRGDTHVRLRDKSGRLLCGRLLQEHQRLSQINCNAFQMQYLQILSLASTSILSETLRVKLDWLEIPQHAMFKIWVSLHVFAWYGAVLPH